MDRIFVAICPPRSDPEFSTIKTRFLDWMKNHVCADKSPICCDHLKTSSVVELATDLFSHKENFKPDFALSIETLNQWISFALVSHSPYQDALLTENGVAYGLEPVGQMMLDEPQGIRY